MATARFRLPASAAAGNGSKARALWSELSLDSTLDRLTRRDRREVVRLSDRALVLVANRLASPGSEHALAQWLESDFVCDRIGRRFVACWRDDAERKASWTPRVLVVQSEDRLAFEQARRDKAMERVRAQLAALQQRVAQGKLKSAEKRGAAAARVLARNHGHRYFG